MSDITDAQYSFFAALIYEKTGNLFKEADYYRLDGRLRGLQDLYEFKDISELTAFYKKAPSIVDLDNLINSATNNETLFFRDKKPFKALKDELVKELLEIRSVKTLKFWSAASSTGQEAYSIIMTLLESFPDLNFSMDATDISDAALEKAKLGIYSQIEVQRGLPATYLIKYFDQLDDKRWQVKKELRAKITFRKLNLLSGTFEKNKYDIVFCRNVMIYFDIESRKGLIKKIEESMLDEGKLILGSGESIIGVETSLKQKFYNDFLCFEKEKK